jgi:hypothetical protein
MGREEQLQAGNCRKGERHESELTRLDAEIEGKERQRHILLRQADLAQSTAIADPVQEPEQKGDDPRIADKQVVPTAIFADDLRSSFKLAKIAGSLRAGARM